MKIGWCSPPQLMWQVQGQGCAGAVPNRQVISDALRSQAFGRWCLFAGSALSMTPAVVPPQPQGPKRSDLTGPVSPMGPFTVAGSLWAGKFGHCTVPGGGGLALLHCWALSPFFAPYNPPPLFEWCWKEWWHEHAEHHKSREQLFLLSC